MAEINKYSDELLDAISMLGFECREVLAKDAEVVLDNIVRRFSTNDKYTYPLWEHFKDFESTRSEYAWKSFSFLENKEILFFFDQSDDNRIFLLNGSFFTQVLENCYRFTFYITNQEGSFVIAYNDHDVLIGVGDAKEWIRDF